jgi:YHS domain-containing protein
MSIQHMRVVVVLAVGLTPAVSSAQHEGHQMPGMQSPRSDLTQCLSAQPAIANVITAAMTRAEAARLSNSPSELRAAVEHLEAALRDIASQSTPCLTAGLSEESHAGHTMPATQAPSSPSTAHSPAGATDPHAGHTMPSPAPESKVPAPNASPSAPSQPAAADPHAGHMMQGTPAKEMDPVNGLMVDPAAAPKATYQGQTYYFSSEQSRKEFLQNPAKYVKKPRG